MVLLCVRIEGSEGVAGRNATHTPVRLTQSGEAGTRDECSAHAASKLAAADSKLKASASSGSTL